MNCYPFHLGDYAAHTAEFHSDHPRATMDQYVRFKHVASVAAGVLAGHSEK